MNKFGISKKYLRFFIFNNESRYVIIQGSRRSAKSFSVYKWLYFISSGKDIEQNLIVCASYPALQNAIQDFQRATGLVVEGSQIMGYHATMDNGSTFQFKAFDSYEKAQGTSCTRLFVEESLNVDENIVTTLSMSASKQIFFAYNPTKKSYLNKYINDEKTNFLKTTYLDNPYLPPEQIAEFENIRNVAMSPTSTALQRYAYQVYVLGEFSSMAGKVFMEIYKCSDDEYSNIPAKEYYGLDFGFVDNKDRTAMVGIKIFDNVLYIKQYIYSGELTKDYELAKELSNCGVTRYDYLFCDYGGMGKTRINTLITADNGKWMEPELCGGFQCLNAVKGKIIDGIQRMLQFDRIVITKTSHALEDEMDNYELNEEGKPKGTDHLIDAARYVTNAVICMGE